MGQIFNRINKIARSYLDDNDAKMSYDELLGSEDDELKRLIDELESEGREKSNDNEKESGQKSAYAAEDPYSVLEVASSASNKEIRNAYKRKIKDYHPDRVAGLGKEIRALAAEKTYSINAAYETIRKQRGF